MSAPLAIDLPPKALTVLRQQAQARRMSPATLAHLLLMHALGQNHSAARTVRPQRDDREEGRGDPTLLGCLRTLLAADLSGAQGWDALQARLAQHGYTFRERGGGLALYSTSTAARICKASELGWSYADLIRRFNAPLPGHSQESLARRMLHRADLGAHPDLFPDLVEEDVILIEDE
ncbi:hypothetical protein [Gymnodinialimonas sp.]